MPPGNFVPQGPHVGPGGPAGPQQPGAGTGWAGTSGIGPAAPWDDERGLNRLKNLDRRPVPPVPHGYVAPRDHEHGLEIQKDWLYYEMAPELVQDRMDLYRDNLMRHQEPPAWLTLQPHQDLREWSSIVQEDLAVEPWAIHAFKEVLQGGPFGVYEANRILAHLMKDSSSSSRSEGSKSRWLYKACNESLEAMRNWEDWDCEAQQKLGRLYVKHDQGKFYWIETRGHHASTFGKGSSSSGGHTGWR